MRGSLSWKRYEEIKVLVAEMYEECGVHNYPIDPFFIAEQLCYVLQPYSELSPEKLEEAFGESDEGVLSRNRLPACHLL